MKTKISVIFALVFCLFSFSLLKAQTALKNEKIPDDLLITLKIKGGYNSSGYRVITITASGDWLSKNYSEMPLQSSSEVINNETGGLKARLTAEKLKFLISEFERIQFFKFGKDFPQEDGKNLSITHAQTETISIRINGQSKEVSNYLGDTSKRNRLLQDLAEKIRGVAIWNLQNGEIPANFQVRYRTTDEDKIQRDFKIESSGEVTESFFSTMPSPYDARKSLPVFEESKIVGKLSKQQLIQLINEFEKIGFSTFKYSPLTKYAGCSNESVPNAEKRTHINVQINHNNQMYASLYENCNPKPETNAAKFEYMANEIEKFLKTIKTIKMN